MASAIKKELETYRCCECGKPNEIPQGADASEYVCYDCDSRLARGKKSGETSAAVGMIGGAALGAAIAGPPGAVVGGIVGALIGKESKGVG